MQRIIISETVKQSQLRQLRTAYTHSAKVRPQYDGTEWAMLVYTQSAKLHDQLFMLRTPQPLGTFVAKRCSIGTNVTIRGLLPQDVCRCLEETSSGVDLFHACRDIAAAVTVGDYQSLRFSPSIGA